MAETCTSEKIAVLTPMPRARPITAVAYSTG
jgi:hypothetical protein